MLDKNICLRDIFKSIITLIRFKMKNKFFDQIPDLKARKVILRKYVIAILYLNSLFK